MSGLIIRVMQAASLTHISCLLVLATAAATGGQLYITPKKSEAPGALDDQSVRLYANSKALVIGIDNYAERGWPKLSLAVKDAEEVADALAAKGFEVTLEKDLTSEQLDRVLRDFFIRKGADPESRLLIWFAGHGHTVQGEGYIVPSDAANPDDDVAFREKALSLRRFGEYMREARAKDVLAVFDSCFAGTVFNVARAAPPPAITLSTALPVRQFVSSGEADQAVSDDGTFRRLFIDALRGLEPTADANRDGYLTGSELGLFMFDKVTNLTNKRQTPRYGKLNSLGYDRGDFVLEMGSQEHAHAVTAALHETATAATPQQLDERLQKASAWVVVKKEFPEWYAEQLKSGANLIAEREAPAQVAKRLAGALVVLRRTNTKNGLAASAKDLKQVATAFLKNLKMLKRRKVSACHTFVGQGELASSIVETLQPETNPEFDEYLTAIFTAIAHGRRSPINHSKAEKADYDALVQELTKLGWTESDLKLFADAAALAKSAPERVCQMVQDWFTAHLAIDDAQIQERLLHETLRTVFSG